MTDERKRQLNETIERNIRALDALKQMRTHHNKKEIELKIIELEQKIDELTDAFIDESSGDVQ